MYGITVVVIVLLSANVLRSTWTFGNKNMFWGGLATFLLAFTLWNIGEKKCVFIPFSNKASILQTVIFVMVLNHFVKIHQWLSSNLLVNCTAGGTSSQVAKSNIVHCNSLKTFISGYATYMKIQFCVYNRLRYLRQEPVYTLDCMGIGVVGTSQKAE